MKIAIITLLSIYATGFFACLVLHLMFLQMVTPALALLRSTFWFLLWTGWFHGTPLPMD